MKVFLISLAVLLVLGLCGLGFLAWQDMSSQQPAPSSLPRAVEIDTPRQMPKKFDANNAATTGRPDPKTNLSNDDFPRAKRKPTSSASSFRTRQLRRGQKLLGSATVKARGSVPIAQRAYSRAQRAARPGMTLAAASSALAGIGARKLDSRRHAGAKLTRFALSTNGLYVMVTTVGGKVVTCSPATRRS